MNPPAELDTTPSWWQRLARNRLLDVGAVVVALLCLVKLGMILPERGLQEDFSHYYMWSHFLLEGRNPYTTAVAPLYVPNGFILGEDPVLTANYPPSFLWFFVPFAVLERHVAFIAWVAAQGLCLAVTLWWTRRLLAERLSRRAFFFICMGVLMSSALYWHLYFSQVQLLLGAILLTAYAWQREGKHTAACLAVAVAGVLKIYPLALLPWFVWRGGTDLRTRAWLAMKAAGTIAALVLVTGVGLWVDFLRPWMPVAKVGLSHRTFNFSLPTFILSMMQARAVELTQPHGWRLALVMVPGAAVLALAYLWCWRAPAKLETEFCLLLVATLIGNAVTWGHYLVLLIFPVAVAATQVVAVPTLRRLLLFVLLVITLNDVLPTNDPRFAEHPYLSTIVNHLPLFGMLGLFVFFASELRCRQRASQQMA